MTLNAKRAVIVVMGGAFVLSLLFVQAMEVLRKRQETGAARPHIATPNSSKECVECHSKSSPGIVEHWKDSTHARKGVACFDCHTADATDVDAFKHYGATIATIVTPRDCSRCHGAIAEEFGRSHHAAAGNILASLDNLLAETVEGARAPFNPHSPTPGRKAEPGAKVNGMASVNSGCRQCHGAKVALKASEGDPITLDELKPGADGKPTNSEAVRRIAHDDQGRPMLVSDSWPNTGIGRLNLDGSRGSCSACHSRHDFSPRRARQPENCGKCHLGPDHPQAEIYEESKHGVAYRDLREHMKLDGETWILGQDYSQAPTCATCHMSGNIRNGGKITHDPGERISWTNRPPISLVMDTDKAHGVVTEQDAAKRQGLIADGWEAKRSRMKDVCLVCHADNWVNNFYRQYDDFVTLYNEKFGKPGQKLMAALLEQGLLTKAQFDEEIEWTWYYLWHHEGRRARHGASMMAPDYTHWHGMYEVADRFYMHLIPEAREITKAAAASGKVAQAKVVNDLLEDLLKRPEHAWFEKELASKTVTH